MSDSPTAERPVGQFVVPPPEGGYRVPHLIEVVQADGVLTYIVIDGETLPFLTSAAPGHTIRIEVGSQEGQPLPVVWVPLLAEDVQLVDRRTFGPLRVGERDANEGDTAASEA